MSVNWCELSPLVTVEWEQYRPVYLIMSLFRNYRHNEEGRRIQRCKHNRQNKHDSLNNNDSYNVSSILAISLFDLYINLIFVFIKMFIVSEHVYWCKHCWFKFLIGILSLSLPYKIYDAILHVHLTPLQKISTCKSSMQRSSHHNQFIATYHRENTFSRSISRSSCGLRIAILRTSYFQKFNRDMLA